MRDSSASAKIECAEYGSGVAMSEGSFWLSLCERCLQGQVGMPPQLSVSRVIVSAVSDWRVTFKDVANESRLRRRRQRGLQVSLKHGCVFDHARPSPKSRLAVGQMLSLNDRHHSRFQIERHAGLGLDERWCALQIVSSRRRIWAWWMIKNFRK